MSRWRRADKCSAKRSFRSRVWKRDAIGSRIACTWCGTWLDNDQFTIEHMLPLSKGGTWQLDNLAAACERCNNARGDDLGPPDWERFRKDRRARRVTLVSLLARKLREAERGVAEMRARGHGARVSVILKSCARLRWLLRSAIAEWDQKRPYKVLPSKSHRHIGMLAARTARKAPKGPVVTTGTTELLDLVRSGWRT